MSPNDLNKAHLISNLAWLDLRLEREVLRWQLAGQDPQDKFRGLHTSIDEALSLTRQPVGSHWGSRINLPDEEEKRFSSLADEAISQVRKIEQQAEEEKIPLRVNLLAEIFELTPFELWSFLICLAPALDLRYERIYGFLQDDVTKVAASIDLILTLLANDEGLERFDQIQFFDNSAPLRLFRLLIPVEDANKSQNSLRQAFQVAPGVVDWILGLYSPEVSLGDWAKIFAAPDSDDEIEIASQVYENEQLPTRDVFGLLKPFFSWYGSDFLQQETVARQVARSLAKPLLSLKFSPEETRENALEKLRNAARDARLCGAIIYFQGCDIFIDSDNCLLPACFEILQLMEDAVLFSSRVAFKFSAEMPGNDYPLMRSRMDGLSSKERASLWKSLIKDIPGEIADKDLDILAGQFSLPSGQVIAAASSAISQAIQAGRALEPGDLFSAARFHSGQHLVELAQKIEPRYQWNDLVLPETPLTMLQEMVSMVRTRTQVLEDWGLGLKLTAGSGVSALFSGPPGTGKTLAAQIIANQLGIDLYRIDLSSVVSKYIGETEKNLERIFVEATQSNAILFFDEADTIFGKRSEVKDAHDRYANLEVGYLLQRMENYSGVAILATNLRANLDEAFTRRLQFIVNFPFPDEIYREKIWRVLIPATLPCEPGLDLGLMARRFKLAGGSIRNIIVSAAYQAAVGGGKVSMTHLFHGARREFQKMGRLLNETDFVI